MACETSWLAAIGDFIKQVGFPAAVAVYLLVRFDPLLRRNTNALFGLARALNDYGVGIRGGQPGRAPEGGPRVVIPPEQ